MRLRFMTGAFLTLLLALLAMAWFSMWEINTLVDLHIRSLVENERVLLKNAILSRMEAAGMLELQQAPPPPATSPGPVIDTASPAPALEIAPQKMLAVVQQTVPHYRLGQGGYAWLFDTRAGQFLLLPAGIGTQEIDNDRQQLPALLATRVEDNVELLTIGGRRYVSFTRMPRADYLVLGITYPQSDIAPLMHKYRHDVALVLAVLLVLGLVLLSVVTDSTLARLAILARLADKLDAENIGSAPPELPAELRPALQALYRLAYRLRPQVPRLRDDAHPLTGLPGRNALTEELFRRIDAGTPMAVALVDLTDFYAYNLQYGYPQGDKVLQMVAGIVVAAVAQHGNATDFVAELEADHFVFVTTPDRADAIADQVVRTFDARSPVLYSAEDRERGFIEATDRRGGERSFPLMKVTVGIVTNERYPLLHPLQIARICTEVCDFLKARLESGHMRDRRTTEREGTPQAGRPPGEEKT